MEFEFYVTVRFINTSKDNDLDISFTVVSDNINHAWLNAINYIKSLGLEPDLIIYFSVELL